MKVSTDACIHGAWTPVEPCVTRILDVGAGTGLLSLMLAQRCPQALIDAVEIDADAALQASENVSGSPFAGRIQVHHSDARTFLSPHRYDLIICNPPFFQNSLAGDTAARNLARHNTHFGPQDLLRIMNDHLAEGGIVSVIWPEPEFNSWNQLALLQGWLLCGQLSVRDREVAPVSRIIGMYARSCRQPTASGRLVIKDSEGAYSAIFTRLLSPFYLNL